MRNNYTQSQLLSQNVWNNAFSFSLRENPSITLPSLKQISHTQDVTLSENIVFEEIWFDWKIRSCKGLEHLYIIKKTSTLPAIVIMDNHNHALYARWQHSIETNTTFHVYHIDQHSDLAEAPQEFDKTHKTNKQYLREFTNLICNVGNFIKPALQAWYISECTQIRTESLLNEVSSSTKKDAYILDIDLDFWAPEMGISQYEKTIVLAKKLIENASLVTIATSPYFIDQTKALEILDDLFS